jgi:hypothetical protein
MALSSLLRDLLRCKLSCGNSVRQCGDCGWRAAGRKTCWPIVPACTGRTLERSSAAKTNVTLQTLKTLADTLKVRITDLLKGF